MDKEKLQDMDRTNIQEGMIRLPINSTIPVSQPEQGLLSQLLMNRGGTMAQSLNSLRGF